MNKYLPALLTAIALGLAGTARADLTWNWTLTGTIDNGSGTLTTEPYSANANPVFAAAPGGYVVAGFLVTGATGTYDGDTVTGVDNLADAASQLWDQLLVPGGFPDLAGLLFTVDNATTPYAGVFFSGTGTPTDAVDSGEVAASSAYGTNPGIFNAVLVSAPEPSQAISMLALAGLGGVSLLGRLRRRK
jgi:hypothetical protein